MKHSNPQQREPQVVMRIDPHEEDEPLRMAPTDPEVDAARARMRDGEPPLLVTPVPADKPAGGLQFSIRQLLAMNVGVAVSLALLQWVAPELIAGLIGIVTLAALAAVSVIQPTQRWAYAVTWGLLLLYIVSALAALVHA